MPNSDFVFENENALHFGAPRENDFVYHKGELVSDSNESNFAFIRERGLGGFDPVVYAVDGGSDADDPNAFYELNYDDFSVKRSVSFSFETHGAGGDADTAWVHENGGATIYKLDAADLSIVDSNTVNVQSGAQLTEIGGDSEFALAAERHPDGSTDSRILKIDADTLEIVDSAPRTDNDFLSASGGTATVFYTGEAVRQDGTRKRGTIEETSTSTLDVVRREDYPVDDYPDGAGGSIDHVYAGHKGTIFELDPEDFSVIRQVSSPLNGSLIGIGGV